MSVVTFSGWQKIRLQAQDCLLDTELAFFSTSFSWVFCNNFYIFYVTPLIHILILVFSYFIFGLTYINVLNLWMIIPDYSF